MLTAEIISIARLVKRSWLVLWIVLGVIAAFTVYPTMGNIHFPA